MSKGYTSEQRQRAKELRAEFLAPKIIVKDERLYMAVNTGIIEQTIDVTPLYHFLKEMFTTDWEKSSE